tara:strand:+ start:555 stop:899 length:345 start_codon:yes stop_codon:yes gene_type:complete
MIRFIKSIFGINSNTNNNIKVLDVSTFKQAVSKNKVQLIDVRTANEYNTGYIKKAKNIDVFSGKFTSEVNKLDKEKPVYVYCRSGGRSKRASKKIAALGFKEIYDLKGGILNYN